MTAVSNVCQSNKLRFFHFIYSRELGFFTDVGAAKHCQYFLTTSRQLWKVSSAYFTLFHPKVRRRGFIVLPE